jgi:hypothetical protein
LAAANHDWEIGMTIGIRAVLLAATLAGIGALGGATALGDGAAQHTYSGTCGDAEFAEHPALQGKATFNPPYSASSPSTTYTLNAVGVCDGTLDGEKITKSSVTFRASGPADLTCTSGSATALGNGALTFLAGVDGVTEIVFPFKFTLATHGPSLQYSATGSEGGALSGRAQFLASSDDETIARCNGTGGPGGNEGIKEFAFDAFLKTDSTLMSTDHASGGGAANTSRCKRLTGKRHRKCVALQKCHRLKNKAKRRHCIRQVKGHKRGA